MPESIEGKAIVGHFSMECDLAATTYQPGCCNDPRVTWLVAGPMEATNKFHIRIDCLQCLDVTEIVQRLRECLTAGGFYPKF